MHPMNPNHVNCLSGTLSQPFNPTLHVVTEGVRIQANKLIEEAHDAENVAAVLRRTRDELDGQFDVLAALARSKRALAKAILLGPFG